MSAKEFTLQEIAKTLSAELHGDPQCRISGIATLMQASATQLSFIANSKYQKHLASTSAGAVLMSEELLSGFSGNALVVDDPYLAYAHVSQLFAKSVTETAGVDPRACVADSAVLQSDVYIAAGAVIGERVTLESGVRIGANTVVGDDCQIGKDSVLEANVTLYHGVRMGRNCLIHSGAVLGSDGFGFASDRGEWVKIAQLGGVVLGDRVEVGACTTIDRGALEDTRIGDGVILDNQIQIAHNVQVGKNTAIAGCTAVAGSTRIGDHCTIAGACGITGHLTIASGSHITAMSLVTKSISEPGAYSSGTGMMPYQQWKKNVVRFRQLDDIARRLKAVEAKISED
ncbi:UDP-3-O-(3-hydroxymyristoyl)glucosamine N-acyltransferase [Neptuniibacter halophilus]|uniref:UDP-3-O-(3-hydroxymyristoyl)glucosamine N-acyltransferase n=1 Tax=Neptuniibacter halophilus TaxID=651666 RepID=UPI0025735F53|nr:UDP-3-O-(3-hydroxymyristoyl)glucosamine N-acyltransferase [Neptuniibacter halophilus]